MNKLLAMSFVVLVSGQSMAVVYTDLLGDVNEPMTTYGNPNVDLSSLEITNDATTISFKFTTNSPTINSPDWIKLQVIMRKGDGPLDTSVTGNGWIRPYNLAGGADRHVGGWLNDGGGLEARQFDGLSWVLNGATTNSTPGMSLAISGPSVTYTLNLSLLNLSVGDTFVFDALTSGSEPNDGAWDLLSQGSTVSGPNEPFTSTSNLTYTVVPEPASMTALVLGAAALLRRRKKA